MAKKLFVGGISWNTTSQMLQDLFAQAGTVVSCNVITDRDTGRSKGFGFVEMGSDEEAEAAKQKFNGQVFDGRTIAVSDARPQEPRESSYSGGGYGRGGDSRDRRGGGNRGNFRGGGGNRRGGHR